MKERTKPWKPQKGNLVYSDPKKQLGISYDHLQWIVKRGGTYFYYKDMSHLLTDGLEDEVKEIIGSDIKTLLSALETATDRLIKMGETIKLKEGYVTQRL